MLLFVNIKRSFLEMMATDLCFLVPDSVFGFDDGSTANHERGDSAVNAGGHLHLDANGMLLNFILFRE